MELPPMSELLKLRREWPRYKQAHTPRERVMSDLMDVAINETTTALEEAATNCGTVHLKINALNILPESYIRCRKVETRPTGPVETARLRRNGLLMVLSRTRSVAVRSHTNDVRQCAGTRHPGERGPLRRGLRPPGLLPDP